MGVLAYVAHDKTTRLPDLARLLICLKLPLLIESQVLCLAALAEGLDEKEEDLSEVLGELLDPWKIFRCVREELWEIQSQSFIFQGSANLCTLFTEKGKLDQAERRALIES